jgi:arabinogalactan oligomer/maltooligosaccharide transport system permease protein
MAARSRRAVLEERQAYAFIGPVLVAIGLTSLLPTVYSLYISLTNFSLAHFMDYEFVGLANYARILTGANRAEFFRVLFWTVEFATISLVCPLAIGHGLALLLNNRHLRGRNVYRTILILPWTLPVVLTCLVWQVILNTKFGVLNAALIDLLGIAPVPWLTEPTWAKASLVLVFTWLAYPFMMTINLGALQSIPPEVHEAAAIDGAGALQRWWYITLPSLRATLAPLMVTSFAYHFNVFNVIYLITEGRPAVDPTQLAGATDNLMTFTYKQMYGQHAFGLTAAYGVIIFLLIGPVTALGFRLSGAFRAVEGHR